MCRGVRAVLSEFEYFCPSDKKTPRRGGRTHRRPRRAHNPTLMLDIQNVTFGYTRGRNVLQDFSLAFADGGIYGLLGRNGTGKSTLLYLAMGLLRPQQGRILYNGADTALRRPECLSDMFIVPEEYTLPNIPLAHYVRAVRPFYPRFSDETLSACLAGFDMPADVSLGALSMGQKKKVYMSVAMAANTRLLVMDEPTNGLDIPSKSQFRRIVAGSMSDERTLIISTHQVRDVEELINRLAIIDRNHVLLSATMEQVRRSLAFAATDRAPQPLDGHIYAEPGMGCYNVVARRERRDETPVNLELLFNALLADAQRVRQAVADGE